MLLLHMLGKRVWTSEQGNAVFAFGKLIVVMQLRGMLQKLSDAFEAFRTAKALETVCR